MPTRAALWIIWCCFVARALFYCAAVPLWEGFDEYSHFALIEYVSTHHGGFPLGAVHPNTSRLVSESRKLTPGAWIIRDANKGILSYDDYFTLAPAEQSARRARLENLPSKWSREQADPREALDEAQQAPLYYWIAAPFYGLMQGWGLPTSVWILRILTMLMASAAIPLAFLVGRRVFRDDAMALGTAVVVASFPQMMMLVGHVSNTAFSIATGALVVFFGLKVADETPSKWSGVWLGTALGAALITKAYFLALIPFAAVVLWLAWRRNVASRPEALWQAAKALLCCMAISAWWYIRNLSTTGSLTGQIEDIEAMANGSLSLLTAVGQIQWGRILDFVAFSHIWLGNWSFLVVRSWMYRVVELIAILAIAGICVQTFRPVRVLPRPRDLWLLALPYLLMVAGLAYHAVQVFRALGYGGTLGYYLYALVVPEAILLIAGLARLMPAQWRALPVPIVAFVLIAMEQFGTWFIMLPYYGGLIRHSETGRLPAAHVQQYWNGGLATFFDHLSGIGPVSSPSVIAATAMLYFLATATLLWCAYNICAGSKRSAEMG